jgi:hypothetical protein
MHRAGRGARRTASSTAGIVPDGHGATVVGRPEAVGVCAGTWTAEVETFVMIEAEAPWSSPGRRRYAFAVAQLHQSLFEGDRPASVVGDTEIEASGHCVRHPFDRYGAGPAVVGQPLEWMAVAEICDQLSAEEVSGWSRLGTARRRPGGSGAATSQW